jgi:hypothetical protein
MFAKACHPKPNKTPNQQPTYLVVLFTQVNPIISWIATFKQRRLDSEVIFLPSFCCYVTIAYTSAALSTLYLCVDFLLVPYGFDKIVDIRYSSEAS